MTAENNIMRNDTREDDSEGEEVLSLRDLPLKGDEYITTTRVTPESSPDIFEFFTDINAKNITMHSAEDIISCGKLLPYKAQSPSASPDFAPRKNYLHRKSESLNDLQRSHSSAKSRFMRSNHSLDYRKLLRDSSNPKMTTTSTDKISAPKFFGKCDFDSSVPSIAQTKPKWSLLMFGAMKAPTEMELKDIRNRQNRLIRSTWLPTSDGQETISVKREDRKATWKLLRALSCKGEASDVITGSFRYVPHV